ncbi:MAG: DUF192 domain-containing protein [Alphaproteobacteria bacterium]
MRALVLRFILFAALALAPALAPPAAAQSAPGLLQFKTDKLSIRTADGKTHAFKVELATTPAERAQGLMFRRSLAPDAGMLFDFGRSEPVAMWMENTLIPLDMLFIAADGRVVNIAQRAVPFDRTPIPSKGPVKGVLELPGGTAARLGLKAGDVVQHAIFAPAR